MALETAAIASALQRKGAVREDRRHIFFTKAVEIDGRKLSVVTHISHGRSRTISGHLVRMMARQCRLSPSEFSQLVSCTLDEAGWDELIRLRANDPWDANYS